MGSRVLFLQKNLHQRDRIRGVNSRLSRFRCGVAIYLSNSLRKTCERAEIPLPLQRENDSQTSFRCQNNKNINNKKIYNYVRNRILHHRNPFLSKPLCRQQDR